VEDGPCKANGFDPLVLINSLAVVTERVQLGVLVGMPYRHPAIVAKMLAAADLLSHGRVILGVATGREVDEFAALGLPAAHFPRRADVTDEYLRAVKEMWLNTGPSSFAGEFVSFADVGAFPKPLQTPHPRVVVAGDDDAATVRASRLGNGYVALGLSPDELAAGVEELRAACRRDRRDPDEIEVLLRAPVSLLQAPAGPARAALSGTVEQISEDLRQYARAGLDHLVIAPTADAREIIDVFAGEILPAFGTMRARTAPR
jgi:alkanesulfonate monooxygenase SsuD/methylene tetrahydromethanopterin reductase-like flavin-dependent oxidoreductase (luciferase family)